MAVVLGPFKLDHPFILAPMAGITNSPFRRLMRERESALVVSELVSANGMEFANEKTKDMLKFEEAERFVGIQIFGEEVYRLCRAAQKVEATGADFVDLNLGCPVQKIVKKGAGCSMARDPKKLNEVLKKIVASVKIPVTIKIRTGWDSASINVFEVVQAAEDAGVSWVAIHGRTRAQSYSGSADWDLIGEVKQRTSLPVIGNGDVHTPEKALERYEDYGVDAVMIGRAALQNPFIFEQARALYEGEEYRNAGADRYLELIRRQRDLLSETFVPRKAMLHGKKFLAWYSSGYPGSSNFRGQVFSMTDADEMWQFGIDFFERGLVGRDESVLSKPLLMGGHG